MADKIALTPLGWTYIGLTAAWTCLLLGGMFFLHLNRHLPSLQMRRLPLMFTAITSLHLYGAMVMALYTFLPVFTCNTEFWIMSTYLPFGIALFQAANSQFLHIATLQKKYVHLENYQYGTLIKHLRSQSDKSSPLRRVKGKIWSNPIDRMMGSIAIGLLIQFAMTFFLFFGSRKFHPGFGLFGSDLNGAALERRLQCTKGWEWWLSIVWQFFWAWIYAPYLLWKSRHFHDVNGWRVQTICCCLAGLPASPLWLAGVYAPRMEVVNKYIIPPQWFSFSIFLLEIFTIMLPCWQVLKARSLQKETLDAIASWEKRTRRPMANTSVSVKESADTIPDKSTQYSGSTLQSTAKSSTISGSRTAIFGMSAMDDTLKTTPEAFLRFAALRDFSGENVSFLINVANWKAAWGCSRPGLSIDELRRQQFIAAIRIYASFASMDLAEFPINLSCQELQRLHNMFEADALMLCGKERNTQSAQFGLIPSAASSTADFKTGLNLSTLGKANLESVQKMRAMEDGNLWDHEIPSSFTMDAFDRAQHEIRYLVFTNTWPKYVNQTFVEKDGSRGSGIPRQRLFHYFRLT